MFAFRGIGAWERGYEMTAFYLELQRCTPEYLEPTCIERGGLIVTCILHCDSNNVR